MDYQKTFSFFLLLFVLLDYSNSLIAYDCKSGNVNMTSVSLINLPDCTINKPNITTIDVNLAVTQTTQFSDVAFFRCSVEEFNIVWRCGKTIDTGLSGGFYSQVPMITKKACLRMVQEGVYTVLTNNEKLDIMLSSTGKTSASYVSRGFISSDGSCTAGVQFSRSGRIYDRPVQNTRLEIKYSSGKARLSHDENTILFPSGVSCKYSDGECVHPDYGYIFWDKLTPECRMDSHEKSLVYNGVGKMITDYTSNPPVNYVQVSYDGYDFQIQLSDQTDFVCGYRSYLTEHPRLFVTLLGKDYPLFPLTKKVQPVDVNLMNYVNSKMVFSMRHTKQEVDRLFQLFELDRCQTQNRITQAMLSIASRDPLEFAYLYFQKPGYTAVVRGEVIHIAKCAETAVEPDMEIEGCYNELPVRSSNVTMFMSPKTRIMIKFGSLVSCLPDLAPRFFVDGNWVSRTKHGLMRVNTPITMTHTNIHYSFSELKSLARGGLYSSETIQSYQEILTSPMVENVISSRVHNALEGKHQLPTGYSFSSGFTEDDFDTIQNNVENWFEKLTSKLTFLGQITSTILGFVIIIKTITYILSCILNFKIMYDTFGFATAVTSFWWESLCNTLLHKKISKKTDIILSEGV